MKKAAITLTIVILIGLISYVLILKFKPAKKSPPITTVTQQTMAGEAGE